MSVNIASGNSASRCSARNANTLPAGISSRHAAHTSGPTGRLGGRPIMPTILAPDRMIRGQDDPTSSLNL